MDYLQPFLDQLQIPLQPLEEDLPPDIYQVFEKCPVKYVKYQEVCLIAITVTIVAVNTAASVALLKGIRFCFF